MLTDGAFQCNAAAMYWISPPEHRWIIVIAIQQIEEQAEMILIESQVCENSFLLSEVASDNVAWMNEAVVWVMREFCSKENGGIVKVTHVYFFAGQTTTTRGSIHNAV